VGNSTIQPSLDFNAGGTAEAFPYTAARTGSSTTISFYVDASSQATGGQLGIYTDSGWNSPGKRLGQASFHPTPGWNTVTLSGTRITSGTKYWLAVLGTGGQIAFRDQATGARSEEYQYHGLTQLPSKWKDGTAWSSGNASFYVGG
jgi:hypothetical protein